MTAKFYCKIRKGLLLRVTMLSSVIAAVFGYKLPAIKLTPKTYMHLQNSNAKWYCIKCVANIIPFSKHSNQHLFETNQYKKIKFKTIKKPLPSEHNLIDGLNSNVDDKNNDLAASKYFEPNERSSHIKNKPQT